MYVEEQIKGHKEVDDRDTDNGCDRFWYEVYEGEPITIDEEGKEVLHNFVYVSTQYYLENEVLTDEIIEDMIQYEIYEITEEENNEEQV